MVVRSEREDGIALRHRQLPPAAQAALLYGAVPLAIAVLFAVMRVGFAALMPLPQGIVVWILLVLPAWWGAQFGTTVAHRLLAPWAPPLWLVCLLGSIAQALLLSPYYRWLFAWAERLATSGRLHGDWPLPELSVAYALALLWSITPGATVWTAVNYLYDRVLDVPRFRYPDAAAREDDAVPLEPTLPPVGTVGHVSALARSRLAAGAEIRALTAEEHYVRVYADAGSDLVRARFSDVLLELADVAPGMQVHRSWWVRVDRVRAVHERGRSCELELPDGVRVPVSLAFREAVLLRLRGRGVGGSRAAAND